jgi:hypothetical protein
MSEYGKKYPGSGGAIGPGTNKQINVTPDPYDHFTADSHLKIAAINKERANDGLCTLDESMTNLHADNCSTCKAEHGY